MTNNPNLNIGFIGGGNMAQSIVAGLLRAGHEPAQIAVAEPALPARERLTALHQALRVTDTNARVAADAAILVLAVKPQVMPTVLRELASIARPAGQLVISVAAGVTLTSLANALGAKLAAVRVMPNQPALVGEGMSALVASVNVNAAQKAQALYIAEAMGRALWIGDEALMDAVTAVSGSGPAYFYLLMEIMEACAVEMGLTRDEAVILVRQTALGAARVASVPGCDVVAMRASVTSPGGTTAAALGALEQAGIRDILQRALRAARDRSADLGRGKSH